MQRIIQINIAGRVLPIEEDAYQILRDYLSSLERHFDGETGKEEILQDIEYRIAELFSIRLQNGAPAIDKQDALKVIETLGPASALNDGRDSAGNAASYFPVTYVPGAEKQYNSRRLYRNPKDKILGGVCGGLAAHFDIDPTLMRLLFAILIFISFGTAALIYIVAWIVIPIARTPSELAQMGAGTPMDFHTFRKNLTTELQDLKKRGEEMSRELRDFFSKKK